jgi:hypothetical protein
MTQDVKEDSKAERDLINSIKWTVKPKIYNPIHVWEEGVVLTDEVDGTVLIVHRSGDVVFGTAFACSGAKKLAESLLAAVKKINDKAN